MLDTIFYRLEYRYHNGIMDIPFKTNNLKDIFNKCYDTLLQISTGKLKTYTIYKIEEVSVIHELSIMMNSFKEMNLQNVSISYDTLRTITDSAPMLKLEHKPLKKHYFIKMRNAFNFGGGGGGDIDHKRKLIKNNLFRYLFDIIDRDFCIFDPIKDYGCSVLEAMDAFCDFWALIQTSNERLGMLSRPVDIIWHYCIGDTELYNTMCNLYGGKFISHEDGTDQSKRFDFQDYIKRTIPYVSQELGFNIFSVWPLPVSLFNDMGCECLIEKTFRI